MITYADTTVCPSCRVPLPASSATALQRCPGCGIALQHPAAASLFRTLSHADVLVAELRAVPVATESVAPTPATAPANAPRHPSVPDVAPPPLVTGVRTSSVPAILLGLGALCLLVAGVTFLAVAWSWLGIGGRTVVLVALSAATGLGGLALGRRSLRVAAESLVTVSLGLLALDIVGADHAGWLGQLSPAGLTLWTGLSLAAAGVVLSAADRRLVAAQLGSALGLLLSFEAVLALTDAALAPLLLAAVALVGLARAGQAAARTPAAWAVGAVASIAWLQVLTVALARTVDATALTMHRFWIDGPGLALVALAVLLLAPVVFARSTAVRTAAGAAAATMLTAVVSVPVLDEGATAIALTSLAAAAGWAGVTVVLRRAVRLIMLVALVPATAALLPALGVSLALAMQAVDRVYTAGSDLTLSGAQTLAAPWLLVLTTAIVLGVASTVVRTPAWPRVAAGTIAIAGIATGSLYPVSLWLVVGAMCGLALIATADAVGNDSPAGAVQTVVAGSVALTALSVSTPSSGLLVLSTAVLTAFAASTTFLARFVGGTEIGALVLPLAVSGLLWSAADVLSVDPTLRAVPVLLVVGALALVRPRIEVELAAGLSAFVASVAATTAASDVATSTALHLTLAGALVSASALVHPSRRALGWGGSVLLLLATWVRLSDLGVTSPEAYTLPTAVALVAVGVHRLLRRRDVATAAMLLPGLLLGTVPSALWVMVSDPVSLRALLLGIACLALVLTGARLRWSAPLVVGAAVGAVLTLVELAPYAAQTPQWVVIGLAGTLLTVVGVTWEHRVVELRRVTGYVGRLR